MYRSDFDDARVFEFLGKQMLEMTHPPSVLHYRNRQTGEHFQLQVTTDQYRRGAMDGDASAPYGPWLALEA